MEIWDTPRRILLVSKGEPTNRLRRLLNKTVLDLIIYKYFASLCEVTKSDKTIKSYLVFPS